MTRRAKIGSVLALGAVVLFGSRNAIAQAMVVFEAPHHIHAAAGTLSSSFASKVDADAKDRAPTSTGELVRFSLDETAAQFHFGLAHKTTLAYDGADREGNCVEYADLFASIIEREGVDVHAYVVRSDARILGQRIAKPAWKDHDWVLVVTKNTRLYVDPTLYDMGLGWNVAGSVRGTVTLPWGAMTSERAWSSFRELSSGVEPRSLARVAETVVCATNRRRSISSAFRVA